MILKELPRPKMPTFARLIGGSIVGSFLVFTGAVVFNGESEPSQIGVFLLGNMTTWVGSMVAYYWRGNDDEKPPEPPEIMRGPK